MVHNLPKINISDFDVFHYALLTSSKQLNLQLTACTLHNEDTFCQSSLIRWLLDFYNHFLPSMFLQWHKRWGKSLIICSWQNKKFGLTPSLRCFRRKNPVNKKASKICLFPNRWQVSQKECLTWSFHAHGKQRNGLGIEWTCYCLLQLIRKDIVIHLLSWTACDGNETFLHGFLLLQSFASCFLFARGSVTRGILEEKTLSLTAAVCMTELRRWTWTVPLFSLQSFQANVHWSSPV